MKIVTKIIAIILIMILSMYTMANIVQASTQKEIVLVIDPGHGGKMTGTVNDKLGIVERDVTLKIARYLRDYLNEYEGIKVIMTHDGLPSDYEMELPARGMVARDNNADMMVSLHINDYATPNEQGAEVFVTANKLLPKYNQESTRFGNLVLAELSKLGIVNRGVKTRLCGDTGPKWEYSDGSVADYYAVIRYPMKGDGEDRGADLAKGEGIPGVLIEHCFMKDNDAKFLDSEEDIKKLARADCNALVAFYGLEKKDPKRVSFVTLNKSKLTMMKGKKETLVATVKPDTAINKKVIWSSSNEEIASVLQNGEVTAKKAGKVTITAKTQDREKIATCEVEVQELQISLSKKETNLLVGKKEKLDYVITPENIENQKVTWKSSDETIVSVSQDGIIEAKKVGTANITVTMQAENKQSTIKVNVRELKEGQSVKIKNLKEDTGKISKIPEKTTVSNFKKNFELSSDLEIEIKDKSGKILTDNKYVGTNVQVQIKNKQTKEILQEYVCIMYGDVNRDGKISALDYAYVKNHMMKVQIITGVNEKIVADINEDKRISALDYAYIKNHMLGIQKIELK